MADVTKVKASDGTIYDVKDSSSYTKDEADALLANKADVGVSYTKAEDDALLAEKANASDVTSGLALKANVVDVYSKNEADNLLAGKADTGVSYTKAEADALLGDKANSADVYTIAQTDGLLADKASVDDSSTTATMATWSASKLAPEFQGKADSNDVYTKTEVDALIGGIKMFPNLDYGNPAHTFSSGNLSFTATKECWLLGSVHSTGGNPRYVKINGTILIMSFGYPSTFDGRVQVGPYRIKVGDTVECEVDSSQLFIFEEVTS